MTQETYEQKRAELVARREELLAKCKGDWRPAFENNGRGEILREKPGGPKFVEIADRAAQPDVLRLQRGKDAGGHGLAQAVQKRNAR